MRTPSLVVAWATFQSSQRPSTDLSFRSTNLVGYCMSSGSQSTSIASTSERPDPAARRVFMLSRASFEVAAFFCVTVMFGWSLVYSASRFSYPNSLNVATVRVIFSVVLAPVLDVPLVVPEPQAVANRATPVTPATSVHILLVVLRTMTPLSVARHPRRGNLRPGGRRPIAWTLSVRGVEPLPLSSVVALPHAIH